MNLGKDLNFWGKVLKKMKKTFDDKFFIFPSEPRKPPFPARKGGGVIKIYIPVFTFLPMPVE